MLARIPAEMLSPHDALMADCDESIRASRSLMRHLFDAEAVYVDSMERAVERIRKSRELLNSLRW
jgi:hypothetical protein